MSKCPDCGLELIHTLTHSHCVCGYDSRKTSTNFRSDLACLKHVEKKLERVVIITSPELAQRAAKELLNEVQGYMHRYK